jgi:hypothetical protein
MIDWSAVLGVAPGLASWREAVLAVTLTALVIWLFSISILIRSTR